MLQQLEATTIDLPDALHLPVSLLARYLFFLTRRPISASNTHYLQSRIDGLKGLGEMLASVDAPGVSAGLAHLRAMNPANFHRLSEGLHHALLPLAHAATRVPPNVVVADSAPRADFIAGAGRILLLMGPAIGVGDECVFFPLPHALKKANPEASITVLSAYKGLWDRVLDVDERRHYEDYRAIVDALRGASPAGKADLVIMADFERPDLYQAVCVEPEIQRYLEVSMGAQSACAVDNRHHWLHRSARPAPYDANFYAGLDYLWRWLNLAGRPAESSAFMRRAASPPTDHLRLYINPFTSKQDPSQAYWSRLIGALFPQSPATRAIVAIDPGPNGVTRRFAANLVRTAASRVPFGVLLEVAGADGETPAGFEGVFSRLERAHVVICADSFVAHAAPLFDCTTMVVASRGLENWRVPHRSSYYFSADDDLDRVAIGMRRVLSRVLPAEPPSPVSELESRLDETTRLLQDIFTGQARGLVDGDRLSRAYLALQDAYDAVLMDTRSDGSDRDAGSLFDDVDYAALLRPLDAEAAREVPMDLQADLARYLRDGWVRWQNSNRRKDLRARVAMHENAHDYEQGAHDA